jgi:hypothetical protein
MSIFSNILNKIFPHDHPATTASGSTVPAAAPNVAPASNSPPSGNPTSMPLGSASAAAGTLGTRAVEYARPLKPLPEMDVDAIFTQKQQQNGAVLDWRSSIVDLVKLLDLDSSLESRKALAQELHYNGNTKDSAAINICCTSRS